VKETFFVYKQQLAVTTDHVIALFNVLLRPVPLSTNVVASPYRIVIEDKERTNTLRTFTFLIYFDQYRY